jgi:hypothetical protein
MKGTFILGFCAIGLMFLNSCNSTQNSNGTTNGQAQGNLRLIATDDPFPYHTVKSAIVYINGIDVRSTSGDFVTVSHDTVALELIDLRNGVTRVLSDLNVPPGSYDQIRLYVDSASITTSNDVVWPLKIPSGTESGLKINISPPIQVSTEISTDLILDFDISRSFNCQGNPKVLSEIQGFHFKPVIRVSNLTTAGTLAGTIKTNSGTDSITTDDLPIEGAWVQVIQNDVVITTAVTDAAGKYQIIGIPAGNYQISFSAENHEIETEDSVDIPAGNVITENKTLKVSP